MGHWWNVEGNTELLEVKPVTVALRPSSMDRPGIENPFRRRKKLATNRLRFITL